MAIESRIEFDDQFGLGIIIIFFIGNFFGNFNVPREEIKGRKKIITLKEEVLNEIFLLLFLQKTSCL